MPGHNPQISLVMPVWNGENYLRPAIESVLGQTFSNFELLIVDDGSTDSTLQIVRSCPDTRIRVLQREHEGIVSALNHGVSQAKAELIARMDADDICAPERLSVQYSLLSKQPQAVLCHSSVELFGTAPIPARPALLPMSRALLAMRLCYQNPIVHSSVLFRKKAFTEANGYLPEERHAEDFGLWGRLLELGPFVATRRPLVRFRLHPSSISKRSSETQLALAQKIAVAHCRRFMDLDETLALRAVRILGTDAKERSAREWLWFTRRCALRLRWKSPELFAWIAKQTVRSLI